MKKTTRPEIPAAAAAALFVILAAAGGLAQQRGVRPSIMPKALLPQAVMHALIDEVSGERQLNTIRLLAPFERNRPAGEYGTIFHESRVILDKLREYGIEECGIEEVPVVLVPDRIWDAESAELWLVEPEARKIVDLEDVPACLCEQSRTGDVTAELVFVGSGVSDANYAGKDVKGRIVLVTGRPYEAHALAVGKYGALGVIACHSPNFEQDPDQVGHDTIARGYDPSKPGPTAPTFGFMVSARTGDELCRMLGEGAKVVVRAMCKTTYHPYRNEVVWALIRGREKPEEELIFTAHILEQMAYQGANDNASGGASILETARVLHGLARTEGAPPLRRSVRFLWIDEHIGTLGYLRKHPEILRRCFANINEDMVGEALSKHRAFFHLVSTPYSMPSCLNDVLANFIEYVGEHNQDHAINRPVKFVTPILSPAGSSDPFYYRIDPFYGASDHTIFLESGIPGVQLGVWPDVWYHTNQDRPDKSDSTQLKRVSIIDTAAALFLATAADKEALDLLGEVSARGMARIADEALRAYALLGGSTAASLPSDYREAANLVRQACDREKTALESVGRFSTTSAFTEDLGRHIDNLAGLRRLSAANLEQHFVASAARFGLRPAPLSPTPEELRLGRLVPVRTKDMTGFFDRTLFLERLRGQAAPRYALRSQEDWEIRGAIDGRRSVLEIRDLVSAEFRPIPLPDVENYIKTLELAGFVVIENRD